MLMQIIGKKQQQKKNSPSEARKQKENKNWG